MKKRLMLGRKAKEGIERCDRYVMKMHKSLCTLHHMHSSTHTIQRNIMLQLHCRQSYITYSSEFVISTSAIAWGELRALIHYGFIYQPMSQQDLVSQINKANKDRKHTQRIYKTTNGAVSKPIQEAEKCMFIICVFYETVLNRVCVCQLVGVCLQVFLHLRFTPPPSLLNPPLQLWIRRW